MGTIRKFVKRIKVSRGDEDRGASLVEYALLLALIAVVCIAAVTFLGKSASNQYSRFGTCWDQAGSGAPTPATCTSN
jgi:pilus assembly protein Flp/PilA